MQNLLADFTILGFDKVNLVMDRGLYSEASINGLLKEHLKFIGAIQKSLSYACKEIDAVYDNLCSFDNFDEQHELYATTVLTEWDYQQERSYKKDVLTDKNGFIYTFTSTSINLPKMKPTSIVN